MRIYWRLIYDDIIDEVALVGRYFELPCGSASICIFVLILISVRSHPTYSLVYALGTCILPSLPAFGDNR